MYAQTCAEVNLAVTAGLGTWVHKPRMQWHTFWNAGDTPLELIEVISPVGFEDEQISFLLLAGREGGDFLPLRRRR